MVGLGARCGTTGAHRCRRQRGPVPARRASQVRQGFEGRRHRARQQDREDGVGRPSVCSGPVFVAGPLAPGDPTAWLRCQSYANASLFWPVNLREQGIFDELGCRTGDSALIPKRGEQKTAKNQALTSAPVFWQNRACNTGEQGWQCGK
jgi:hypothetical protein